MKRLFFVYTQPLYFKNIYASLGSVLLTKGNKIWIWGRNDFGQLGINSTTNKSTPVTIFYNKIIKNISFRSFSGNVIDTNGQVWSWGYNFYGELGDDTTTCRSIPITILGAQKIFCKISAGYYHTLSIDKNNQLWAWGRNGNGQLGDNSTTQRLTPVSILGSKKTFCQIIGGEYFSMSIDMYSQVWGWGYNGFGQLGDNSTTQRLTPVSILGAKKTFCQITAGRYHSTGLDKNSQVWSWGYNHRGQLGDNSTTSRRTPVSILGNRKTFCQITSSLLHSLGIDKNGQVWGWGYNNNGQLGDNSVTSRRTPVSILGDKKTFCQVSAGTNTSVGIDKNGQVWGWGWNGYGQLGDNSTISRRTPVRVCNI